jgi:hypothetical protein
VFFSSNEAKKKTKSVPIAHNGVGAHTLLGHKPFREKLLQQERHATASCHNGISHLRSSRLQAHCINSGHWVRYQ